MSSEALELLNQSRAEHQAALEKIQEIEKREKWLKDRRGKFTSSEYGRLMGYENDPKYQTQLTKGGMTYAYEKYLETITSESDSFSTSSTEHGNEFEKEAAVQFMEETGLVVANYGIDQEFIELGEHLGCTPDGLIGDDAGFESKCPNSKTHDHYLSNIQCQDSFKKTCSDYYWQIQGSMYITGRKKWYFVSYDPRFVEQKERLLILRIDRNEEDIENLKNRLRLAIGYKLSLLKKRANRPIIKIV